jgi:CRISPR/Cas system-associated endonuclease Cas1
VQEPGARVSKSGEVLVIKTEEQETEVPIGDVSELVLHGPVSLLLSKRTRPPTEAAYDFGDGAV